MEAVSTPPTGRSQEPPKTIRYRLLHVAGRITTSARRPTLRLDRDWPWLDELLTAFARIRAIPLLA
jgi:hypothetical protein